MGAVRSKQWSIATLGTLGQAEVAALVTGVPFARPYSLPLYFKRVSVAYGVWFFAVWAIGRPLWTPRYYFLLGLAIPCFDPIFYRVRLRWNAREQPPPVVVGLPLIWVRALRRRSRKQ